MEGVRDVSDTDGGGGLMCYILDREVVAEVSNVCMVI